VAKTSLNHKVGFVDKTGKEIVTPKYDDAWVFHEGLARVKLNGKEFYIKVFPDGRVVEYYEE
jgi:mannose-6-phosphate isomerase-like protein (cupin superfamily)